MIKKHPDLAPGILHRRIHNVLSSLLGSDETSLDFTIFFKWAAEVKITEADTMMLQRLLMVSELDATAIGTQLLIIFNQEFRSTVWATRCERMGAWEKAHNIDLKSKRRGSSETSSSEISSNNAQLRRSRNSVNRAVTASDTDSLIILDDVSATRPHIFSRLTRSYMERKVEAINRTFVQIFDHISSNLTPPWLFQRSQYAKKRTNIDEEQWIHILTRDPG